MNGQDNVKIVVRRLKKGYMAIYNGKVALARTPEEAIERAKSKWKKRQLSKDS